MPQRALLLAVVVLAACQASPPPLHESPNRAVPRPVDSALDLYRAAYASIDRGHFEEALALATAADQARARSAEATTPSSWAIRVLRAEALGLQHRNKEALALLADPPRDPQAPEVRVRAAIVGALARCRLATTDHAARIAYNDLAAVGRLAEESGLERLLARAMVSRSACAAERAWLPLAETCAQRGLALARRARAPLEELSAAGMLSYVRLNIGRFDDAANWAQRARALAMQLGNDLLLVKANGNLARSYALSGQVERALPLLEDNVRVARSSPAYEQTLLIELINSGDAYSVLQDSAHATRALREAAGIAERRADRQNLARALKSLGLLSLARGNTADAYAEITRALQLKQESHDDDGVVHARVSLARVALARGELDAARNGLRLALANRAGAARYRLEARALLAALYARMGNDVHAARQFERTSAEVETGRLSLSEPSSRIAFVSTLAEFYDSYVEFLVSRGRTRAALEVADRSRARLLLERLGARGRRPRALGTGEFQQLARHTGTTLLSYWLAPKQSYLWAVAGSGVELHTLPGQDALCREVSAYQALVQTSRDPLDERRPEGRALYDRLVGPVARHLPRGSRALLVLDGCLHQLNFETLLPPDAPPRYWIEDVTLSVAPSLGALDGSTAAAAAAHGRALLLIGAPQAANGDFPPLAQAEREVTSVAALFPSDQVEAHTGAQAQPTVYAQARPERFALIHFAAHASANRDSPLDSAVILSPHGDDYKLYARDVLDVPLRADLVTLSACHSAGARAYAGEGLVGLAWAFLSAGSRHVVAGLWNVEDASTADLMAKLYRGLRDGRDAADALRAAKLELLGSQTAYRKPFYWAPFMVYTRAPARAGGAGRLAARTAGGYSR